MAKVSGDVVHGGEPAKTFSGTVSGNFVLLHGAQADEYPIPSYGVLPQDYIGGTHDHGTLRFGNFTPGGRHTHTMIPRGTHTP